MIAAGLSVRDRARRRRLYGLGRWRKMKGVARIRLLNGDVRMAELHWYEAHGIGKREIKRKGYVDCAYGAGGPTTSWRLVRRVREQCRLRGFPRAKQDLNGSSRCQS